MEEIWDHSDRSVKKPVKVRDLWYQLLNSESVHPHITSFSDFENALRDAYENNEIAFRYGSQLIWLRHPYSMDEAKQYYRSRRGRLNDWVSDVKTRLDRLHIKLEDLEIISPRYIIHEYIDYLQRQKQVSLARELLGDLLSMSA